MADDLIISETSTPDPPPRLTPRQKAFIAAYLGPACLNATEAARLAGYAAESYDYLRTIGHKMVTNGHVKRVIQKAVEERCMPAEEILARMSDIARGNLDDFTEIDDYGQLWIRPQKIKERGVGHTFKGAKYDKDGRLELERYSSMEAMVHLAKIKKMFSEEPKTVNNTLNVNMTMEEAAEKMNRLLTRIQARQGETEE